MENIIKVTLKNQDVGCDLESSIFLQGPQEEHCKHGSAYKTKTKVKEHNKTQHFNICIRNLDTKRDRKQINILKESLQKNFRPSIRQRKIKLENINQ
jgi:hypothetical protein